MATTDVVDVMVIGAGVVGLAVARALALAGREVIVVERHRLPGQETSSRNSGVIHSGIYYPHDSLKARLCVHGRELLYEFCAARGIAHSRCGKLIVAQSDQVAALEKLEGKGRENGVKDLAWLSAEEVRELEPAVRCAAGLWSPSTGIVDVHEYITALVADIEAHDGTVVYGSELQRVQVKTGGFVATLSSDNQTDAFECRTLINSAGLGAIDLLRRIDGYPADRLRTAWYAKGNYFVCHGVRPFRHLVYPMPNEAGLGVHATLDLDGTTRFGPDVEWIDGVEYAVDARRAADFYAAIREYWPGLPDGCLQPGYAGVRPKLVGAGAPAADFVIESSEAHGIPGLVNLLGIESPGLTSSLALAETVVSRV
jgi:L-2-hydroxyglutarate oxidase LhgO